MKSFRVIVTAFSAGALLLAGGAPALATTGPVTQANYPACGSHFSLTRTRADVRVVGTGLDVFMKGYGLVFASANGKGYGGYNASSTGGANFQITTSSTTATDISITLTNAANTVTYCSSVYHA